MKVRIVNQPSGLLNGNAWPAPGEEIELPDSVAEGMAAAGAVEIVKAEKKAASKPDKAEKRPAAKAADVETRKG